MQEDLKWKEEAQAMTRDELWNVVFKCAVNSDLLEHVGKCGLHYRKQLAVYKAELKKRNGSG